MQQESMINTDGAASSEAPSSSSDEKEMDTTEETVVKTTPKRSSKSVKRKTTSSESEGDESTKSQSKQRKVYVRPRRGMETLSRRGIPTTPSKTETKPFFFSPQTLEKNPATVDLIDLKNSTLHLKFVNREVESEQIVQTFVRNKRQQNLSQAKLVSLFQTFGIGKTTLVRRFREVYDYSNNGKWSEEYAWVKDLQLFELDFRYFTVSSEEIITNMSKKIADFVIKEYNKQFITKFQSRDMDLLQKRKDFYQKLLDITRNHDYEGAKDIFEALNTHKSLPEGYLVLVDEVDGILKNDFGPLLQDTKWITCKSGCNIYSSRFLELWTQVVPLVIPHMSTVIFSGHIPIHLALTENQGSLPSDYCLVFLSPMKKQVIEIMITQSMVQMGDSIITLLEALQLLGLKNLDEFIDILIEYTGTVPRIMENAFNSILLNLNNVSSAEEISTAFEKSEQKQHDVTINISDGEQAKLLAHLYLLHSFGISIPYQTKLYFNKRERNFIEVLPYLKIHFQVMEDKTVKINIPKPLKDDILAKLSNFKTSLSGVCYNLLHNSSILLNAPKALELSVIDLLTEQILALSFSKNSQVTIFGDLCGGIFKDTFFSSLEIPSNFLTQNILIPGFSSNSSKQKYSQEMGFSNYLHPNYASFTSVLDNAMSEHPFCAAIPGEFNSGFDLLVTLNKTPSQVLRKLLLFEMKLYEENFSLTNLQEEIDQATRFLPNTYTVTEKPTLQGENLHFTLIMVVMGYTDVVKSVIEENANSNGSLLINGTCYLQNEKIIYTQPKNGTKSWLKLKGGLEVLLLTRKGLENLLSTDLYNLFLYHSHKKEELYQKMICKIAFPQKTPALRPPPSTSNIGSSQMHANQATNSKTLQRARGTLTIQESISLDKSNPKSWNPTQLAMVLSDTIDGVGLDEEELQHVKLKGRDLDFIVDALLSFNGDKEAKISHATSQPLGIGGPKIVPLLVVRWVYNNLLESIQ